MIDTLNDTQTMHNRLCSMKSTLRAISRLEESIRESYEITLTEALCLCSAISGCSYGSDLAEEVGLSPSRLSRVLSSLEKKGLVFRSRDERDHRKYEVLPTEEGRGLLTRMNQEGIDIPQGL